MLFGLVLKGALVLWDPLSQRQVSQHYLLALFIHKDILRLDIVVGKAKSVELLHSLNELRYNLESCLLPKAFSHFVNQSLQVNVLLVQHNVRHVVLLDVALHNQVRETSHSHLLDEGENMLLSFEKLLVHRAILLVKLEINQKVTNFITTDSSVWLSFPKYIGPYVPSEKSLMVEIFPLKTITPR